MRTSSFFPFSRLLQTFFPLLIVLACLLTEAQAQIQGNRVKDPNQNAWLMYFGDHRINQKLGIHTEAQLRRARVLSDPQQLLLRTGINFYPTENAMLTLGYAYVDTYPYGDYPAAAIFPEHRLYQQLQLGGSAGIFRFTHRYRLEQRWVHFPNTDAPTFLHRARYMFRAVLPLQGPTVDDKEFYLAAYDEIFIGFGKQMGQNFFDQNRLFGAIGYKITPRAQIELGYLNQIVQQRNGRVFEHNHTLQAALYYNLDLRRQE